LGLLPQLLDVARAHADQAALEAAALELVERLDRALARDERLARKAEAQPHALGDDVVLEAEAAEVAFDRPLLARVVRRVPGAVEVLDVARQRPLDVLEAVRGPE